MNSKPRTPGKALLLIACLVLACAPAGCADLPRPAHETPTASSTPAPTATPTLTPVPTLPFPAGNWVARGNLMRSFDKFEGGKFGRVAFLGGSVTLKNWRELVMDYLRQRFPATTFDFINAGLAGTPAELGAFRLEQDVFADGPVDLLFLEFAVNGGSLEAMEGIVRHARQLSPDIDIVQLEIAARWFSDSLDNGIVPQVILDHERVAEHYGNSSILLYREVYERMNANEFGWVKFAPDGVHPTTFGSTVYADTIIRFLEAMAERGGPAMPPSIPEPLTEHPWEHAFLVGPEQATSVSGFDTVPGYMPGYPCNVKAPIPIITASRPGATVSFSFDGTIVGLYAPIGPDSAKVDYSIDGADWIELDTARDTWYPNDCVRLSFFILNSSLSASRHTITFRTVYDGENVFRLYKLMVE